MNNKKMVTVICIVILCISAISLIFIISNKNKNYTITFDTTGGSYIQNEIVKRGQKVVRPDNPTKEGYNFVRWEYNNLEYNFTSPVKEDMTLSAIWEKITTYTVTFNLDKETKTLEVTNSSEIDLDKLGFEEKSGYVIKWYLEEKEYDFTTPITSDLKLTGKYEKATSFTIKFNTDGGSSVANQTINIGEKIKKPTNPTKYGYIFDGWYLNDKKYDLDTAVTTNLTLVAKWKEDSSVKRYTVTFNNDGKTTTQTVLENDKISQPAVPSKTGYRFDGWYLNNKKYDFNSKVTSNITLIAKFTVLTKYTVTFNSDGGSSVASQTVIDGNKVTKPANPTKSGYIFKEWQLNGTTYNFNNKVNKNITLKAVWERAEEKHTVTFDSNGGSSVASQTVIDGNKVTKPANPTKSGYIFKEWQFNGRTYDFDILVTCDITLIAKWTEVIKNNYTVTFDSNGGSSVNSQTVVEGNKAIQPTNPTRNGYNFAGWLLNGNAYDFNSTVTSNITLVAKWTQKSYTIGVTRVDAYSPDSTLSVYEEGTKITVQSIKYSDGTYLCSGTNTTVNTNDIAGETNFIVVLNDGTQVRATLQ